MGRGYRDSHKSGLFMKRIELTTTADSIPRGFSADISIVIDVLRASSVIITALANGTPFILPAAGIDEARILAVKYPDALLAGERQAVKIPGFDRGNSPLECLSDLSGRPLILTTTNGTLTLSKVNSSKEILIASFLNIQAVADYLNSCSAQHIHLACAGTNGKFSLDDFLMAGGLINRLTSGTYQADDLSVAATQIYQSGQKDLHQALQQTTHYQTLLKKGFEQDLNFCLQENVYSLLGKVILEENKQIMISKVLIDVHQRDLPDHP